MQVRHQSTVIFFAGRYKSINMLKNSNEDPPVHRKAIIRALVSFLKNKK